MSDHGDKVTFRRRLDRQIIRVCAKGASLSDIIRSRRGRGSNFAGIRDFSAANHSLGRFGQSTRNNRVIREPCFRIVLEGFEEQISLRLGHQRAGINRWMLGRCAVVLVQLAMLRS
jgi:hypothetical protein